jgi:excisionase family DNA binding protein
MEPKLLLTVGEVAHALSIGRSQVYKLLERGTLQSLKIGNSRRIPIKAVHDYLHELRVDQYGSPTSSMDGGHAAA